MKLVDAELYEQITRMEDYKKTKCWHCRGKGYSMKSAKWDRPYVTNINKKVLPLSLRLMAYKFVRSMDEMSFIDMCEQLDLPRYFQKSANKNADHYRFRVRWIKAGNEPSEEGKNKRRLAFLHEIFKNSTTLKVLYHAAAMGAQKCA